MSKQNKVTTGAVCLITSIGSLALSPAVPGQEGKGLSIDVSDCVKLESDLERYACYERHVDAARSAADPAAGESQSPPAAPAAPAPTAEPPAHEAPRPAAIPTVSIGDQAPPRTEKSAPRRSARSLSDAAEESAEDDQAADIFGTVAALQERVPNAYLITLENGQVWRQMTSERYLLRVGDRVRIYPTHWGKSYRLTVAERHGFIQVQRVR